MSEENIEALRASIEAFNAGDMDTVREMLDPAVVIARDLEGWPEPGPVAGREAVMRSWQGILDAFPEATIELVSVTDVGDRVVLEYFWDHAEALASLGLSEECFGRKATVLVAASN